MQDRQQMPCYIYAAEMQNYPFYISNTNIAVLFLTARKEQLYNKFRIIIFI